VIPQIRVPYIVRPAIVLCGLIAGFGVPDQWELWASLIAAWFVGARSWEPYLDERKPDEASG